MLKFSEYVTMRNEETQNEVTKKYQKKRSSKEDSVEKLGKEFDKNVYQGHYDKIAYGRFEVGLDEGKKKKWIQQAIKHPGRCADMGGPDCPEGSPQYNLAKRFKQGGDLYAGKKK